METMGERECHNEQREDRNDSREACNSWREWLKPPTLITVILLLLTAIGGVYAMRESITGTNDALTRHAGTTDIHHTTEALDATYARKDVLDARLESIDRRLSRIEDAVGTER